MADPKQARHLRVVSTTIADEIEKALEGGDWITCPKCGGEWREFQMAGEVCKPCSDKAMERAKLLGAVFGDRARLVSMAQARFEITGANSRAYDAAVAFDHRRDNLYLWSRPIVVDGVETSGTGTGKTMLATKIIKQALNKGTNCAFEIPQEWLRCLYGASGESQQREIDRLASSPVLVLDDIGLEPVTESGFSNRALYDVINSRWLANRNGLVVTSNLSLGLLAARLGDDRITSRLGGMCKVIELSGKDWRQPE